MRCRLLLLISLLCLGVAGCGVKGPLFLPDSDVAGIQAHD
jgi:predicted small lipoprotein YifL